MDIDESNLNLSKTSMGLLTAGVLALSFMSVNAASGAEPAGDEGWTYLKMLIIFIGFLILPVRIFFYFYQLKTNYASREEAKKDDSKDGDKNKKKAWY